MVNEVCMQKLNRDFQLVKVKGRLYFPKKKTVYTCLQLPSIGLYSLYTYLYIGFKTITDLENCMNK